MPCYHPLQGYRGRSPNRNGKLPVIIQKKGTHLNPNTVDLKLPITISCGQCIGCRLEKSRQWAIRCVHEASLHKYNSFLTLTYSDQALPLGNTLVKKHYTNFQKRLRSRISPQKVRYYMCGEYGETNSRPHYHSLLFGYEFPDKQYYTTSGNSPIYTSDLADDIWSHGHVFIGDVTFESAAYVARYILKKVNGEQAEEHYQALDPRTGELHQIIPEYTNMSRNKGIGTGWLEKYKEDVYPEDEVIIRGRKMQPPAFYDSRLDKTELQKIKRNRKYRAEIFEHDNTPERLLVKEAVTIARTKLRE